MKEGNTVTTCGGVKCVTFKKQRTKVHLKKVRVPQLFEECQPFYGTPRFTNVFTTAHYIIIIIIIITNCN